MQPAGMRTATKAQINGHYASHPHNAPCIPPSSGPTTPRGACGSQLALRTPEPTRTPQTVMQHKPHHPDPAESRHLTAFVVSLCIHACMHTYSTSGTCRSGGIFFCTGSSLRKWLVHCYCLLSSSTCALVT